MHIWLCCSLPRFCLPVTAVCPYICSNQCQFYLGDVYSLKVCKHTGAFQLYLDYLPSPICKRKQKKKRKKMHAVSRLPSSRSYIASPFLFFFPWGYDHRIHSRIYVPCILVCFTDSSLLRYIIVRLAGFTKFVSDPPDYVPTSRRHV